ncbi:MAG: hypothetical protein Q4G68_05765 [Planctomycetia bacterium]|nr:hypothetical protein [Planctomycetia bacterium]
MTTLLRKGVVLLLLTAAIVGSISFSGCKTAPKKEKDNATLQEFLSADKPSW